MMASRLLRHGLLFGVVAIAGVSIVAQPVSAQAAIGSKMIITDGYGALVARLIQPVRTTTSNGTTYLEVDVETRATAPDGVPMSSLAPAFTPTPTVVRITIPAASMIGFCTAGDYYSRLTGLCADGKQPYMIVPAVSLSNPAAATPKVICTAPRVATFLASTSTWSCLVPPGYKITM